MDKRLTFNEDARNYDRWRPTYCEELFRDILQHAGPAEGKKALEVGIGTGQATPPFLRAGFDVTAVELGRELAAYSRKKFKSYANFHMCNVSFEDFECENGSFDVLYSATAFHWIPSEIGYPKAARLLKDGGTLALFWNRPSVSPEDAPLRAKMDIIYEKYTGSNPETRKSDEDIQRERMDAMRQYGFRDVELRLHHSARVFDASGYVSLINTYSDHRMMDASLKPAFEQELRNAILENGDVIHISDTIDLHLARK